MTARVSTLAAVVPCICSLMGCSVPVSTNLVTITLVEEYPTSPHLGESNQEYSQPPGPFLKFVFESNPNLAVLSRRRGMRLKYDFFACNAPDQYTSGGNIFEEGGGLYAAYVPARASELGFWVTGGGHGQGGRGWPDELVNETLCFRVEGGVPYESTIDNRPIRLEPSVNRMLDFGQ